MSTRPDDAGYTQSLIDFEAAEFRAIVSLAAATLAAGPSRQGVAGRTLGAVLQAVYEHGRGRPCWASQRTLAETAARYLGRDRPLSERQTRTALLALESACGLLVSYRAQPAGARDRRTFSHHVIIWTDVHAYIRRERGVTRQTATRPSPASRPDLADGVQAVSDTPHGATVPLPVDHDPLPVDHDPLPVDVGAHYISARPRRSFTEGIHGASSSTCPALHRPARGRPAGEGGGGCALIDQAGQASAAESAREDTATWQAIDAALLDAGVGARDKLLARWQAAHAPPGDVLEAVQHAVRVARHHADRWRSGVGAAVYWRLDRGAFPVAVDEDLSLVASRAKQQSHAADIERWEAAHYQAVLAVRRRTPRGVAVYADSPDVIAEAVRRGAPREWLDAQVGRRGPG